MPPQNKIVNPFADIGFTLASQESPRRLLVGSRGLPRCGKTSFGLKSAPAPIGYVGLDFGHEGVIERYAKERMIAQWTYNVPQVAQQSEYQKHWVVVKQHVDAMIAHPKLKTGIIDTGTDIWSLLRLAAFGTLNPKGDIKQIYNEVNTAYMALIKQAYDRQINLIVVDRVKPHYTSKTVQTQKGPQTVDSWDGVSYKRDGFGNGGYLIQVQIEHLFDKDRPKAKSLEDRFGLRVIDCRQNMDICGLELWGKQNSFPSLATYVFPDTEESDWE